MGADARVKTFAHNAVGRLTSETGEGETWTTHYDRYGRAVDPAAPPLPPPSEPLPPGEPIQRLFAHTFELRLSGSEEQRVATYLPKIPAGDRIVVTTDEVRTLVTRGGESAGPCSVVGSTTVRLERRPAKGVVAERLVCIAQVSDFGAGDLVVVQVDVTAYWVLIETEPF